MDKEKVEKMLEMMKGCCTDEKGMANCCAMMMMKKMMQYGEGKETEKKKKDTEETG